MFALRSQVSRNETSVKLRLFTQSAGDKRDEGDYDMFVKRQHLMTFLEILATGSVCKDTTALNAFVLERYINATHYDSSQHVRIKRGVRKPTCRTLESALQHASKFHHHQRFEHLFMFRYEDMKRLVPILFPHSLRVYRR